MKIDSSAVSLHHTQSGVCRSDFFRLSKFVDTFTNMSRRIACEAHNDQSTMRSNDMHSSARVSEGGMAEMGTSGSDAPIGTPSVVPGSEVNPPDSQGAELGRLPSIIQESSLNSATLPQGVGHVPPLIRGSPTVPQLILRMAFEVMEEVQLFPDGESYEVLPKFVLPNPLKGNTALRARVEAIYCMVLRMHANAVLHLYGSREHRALEYFFIMLPRLICITSTRGQTVVSADPTLINLSVKDRVSYLEAGNVTPILVFHRSLRAAAVVEDRSGERPFLTISELSPSEGVSYERPIPHPLPGFTTVFTPAVSLEAESQVLDDEAEVHGIELKKRRVRNLFFEENVAGAHKVVVSPSVKKIESYQDVMGRLTKAMLPHEAREVVTDASFLRRVGNDNGNCSSTLDRPESGVNPPGYNGTVPQSFTLDMFRKAYRSLNNSGPFGVFGPRPAFLKSLLSQNLELEELFYQFMLFVRRNWLHPMNRPLLSLSVFTPMMELDKGKVRPIQCPELYFRVAAVVRTDQWCTRASEATVPFAFSLKVKSGTGAVYVSVELHRAGRPGDVVALMDLSNMFGEIDMKQLAVNILREFPDLWDSIKEEYALFYTADQGIVVFESKDGVHSVFGGSGGIQGDAFMAIVAPLVLNKAFKMYVQAVGPETFLSEMTVSAYMDDVTAVAPLFHAASRFGILAKILSSPPFNFIVSPKTTVLAHNVPAHVAYDILLAIWYRCPPSEFPEGFPPVMIGGELCSPPSFDEFSEGYNSSEGRVGIEGYFNTSVMRFAFNGSKLLGYPIGSDEYKRNFLRSLPERVVLELSRLLPLCLSQHILLLARMCVHSFISSYMRVLPPSLSKETLGEIDNLFLKFGLNVAALGATDLMAMVTDNGVMLPEYMSQMFQTPLYEGGLGFTSLRAMNGLAFVAGMVDSYKALSSRVMVGSVVSRLLPLFTLPSLEGSNWPDSLSSADQVLWAGCVTNFPPLLEVYDILSVEWSGMRNELGSVYTGRVPINCPRDLMQYTRAQRFFSSWLAKLKKLKLLARPDTPDVVLFSLNASHLPGSGAVFRVFPSSHDFSVPPHVFSAILRLQIGVPNPFGAPLESITCPLCNCDDGPLHGMTCKVGSGSGPIATHDKMVAIMRALAKDTGANVHRREPRRLLINPETGEVIAGGPDIQVALPATAFVQELKDLTVVGSVSANNMLRFRTHQSPEGLKAVMARAAAAKDLKFKDLCVRNGYRFGPLTVSTTGQLHSDTVGFLKACADGVNNEPTEDCPGRYSKFGPYARDLLSTTVHSHVVNHALQIAHRVGLLLGSSVRVVDSFRMAPRGFCVVDANDLPADMEGLELDLFPLPESYVVPPPRPSAQSLQLGVDEVSAQTFLDSCENRFTVGGNCLANNNTVEPVVMPLLLQDSCSVTTASDRLFTSSFNYAGLPVSGEVGLVCRVVDTSLNVSGGTLLGASSVLGDVSSFLHVNGEGFGGVVPDNTASLSLMLDSGGIPRQFPNVLSFNTGLPGLDHLEPNLYTTTRSEEIGQVVPLVTANVSVGDHEGTLRLINLWPAYLESFLNLDGVGLPRYAHQWVAPFLFLHRDVARMASGNRVSISVMSLVQQLCGICGDELTPESVMGFSCGVHGICRECFTDCAISTCPADMRPLPMVFPGRTVPTRSVCDACHMCFRCPLCRACVLPVSRDQNFIFFRSSVLAPLDGIPNGVSVVLAMEVCRGLLDYVHIVPSAADLLAGWSCVREDFNNFLLPVDRYAPNYLPDGNEEYAVAGISRYELTCSICVSQCRFRDVGELDGVSMVPGFSMFGQTPCGCVFHRSCFLDGCWDLYDNMRVEESQALLVLPCCPGCRTVLGDPHRVVFPEAMLPRVRDRLLV